MTNPKLPLIIVRQSDKLKATTSVDTLYDDRKKIRHDLDFIERDYTLLTKTIKEIHSSSKLRKKSDPRDYWLIGEYIISFLQRLDSLGFYLNKQNATIARDTSTSESSIEKILSFRRRFPSISSIDPAIPWSHYRANKVSTIQAKNHQE